MMDDHEQRRKHWLQAACILLPAAAAAAYAIGTPLYDPIPYHTSILSGPGWVAELLGGHLERIRNELGMHKHVFLALVNDLKNMGLKDSKHAALEEQLSIFLYTCVTGLSIRHVGERFQRSNETISK